MTYYTVLRLNSETENEWVFHSKVEASSPKRAVRTAALEPGTYVAVPTRSFVTLVVTVEQTTKITVK